MAPSSNAPCNSATPCRTARSGFEQPVVARSTANERRTTAGRRRDKSVHCRYAGADAVKLIRTDILSLQDLRFAGVSRTSRLSSLTSARDAHPRILARLNESYSWLFYGEQLQDFELFDISSAVPQTMGAALRINQRLGIGSFISWRTYDGEPDPLSLKRAAWEMCDEDLGPVYPFFKELRGERFYPFVAIEADTDDVDGFAAANAEELGRILTGDLEGERPATLRKYIDGDLSLRSYEKLLVRWTEGLVLYSRMDSQEKYENCMFRALQVFEHCILARVSLLTVAEQIEQFQRHLSAVTPAKWLKSRELLTTFSNIEETFVMYPSVQSVEADRLISGALSQFGLSKVVAHAKAKQSELREQLEWAKAQTLGFLAFITYLLDKIVGWDQVRHLIVSEYHHLFH
jgi:hypothetical protein